MSKTPRKQSNNPAGRPRIGDERRVPISASVPESLVQRVRLHAERTGQSVSEVVAYLLDQLPATGDIPPDTESHEPLGLHDGRIYTPGGYDPSTGSY